MKNSAKKLVLVLTVLVSLLAFASVGYAEEGLVARYTFNGDFKDVSGNNNHGTVVGGVTLADDNVVGKCAVFSGGYIEVPSKPNLNMGSAFTISVWLLLDTEASKGNKTNPLVSKLDNRNLYNTYFAYARGTFGARMDLKTIKNPTAIIEAKPFTNYKTDENWTNFVFTFDGQRVYLYVNGSMANSRDLKVPGDSVEASNGKVRIGTGAGPTGNLLLFGKLADVRLYNIALGAGEIQALAAAGASYQ